MVSLGAGKIDTSKVLIDVTSYSNYEINNEDRIDFNQHKKSDAYSDWYYYCIFLLYPYAGF
ncbi:hypothetical protein [Psychromonas aquimarina]|uniref:hypothetical protein n=1 Tax=Psychromonas aquimarina TaxID=444919 RepID=UPI000419243D|nr:hypothetical protein [Psychromonas aquimarina]